MITWKLCFSIISIALGASFQFGYQTGVVNAPLAVIEQFIESVGATRNHTMTADEVRVLSSLLVAAFPVGGLFGALVAGWMANRFGRKKALLFTEIPTIIGAILMTVSKLANSFELIISGRLIIGFACGIYTGVAPMYLSELAPVNIRGAAGTINQFAIVIAILISQILGLPYVLGGENTWQYLLGFSIIPAVLQLVSLPFCPESPRYLMLAKRDTEATKKVLTWLRDTDDIHDEMAQMKHEADLSVSVESLSIKDLFTRRYLRLAILVAIGLHLSQQLSGVNAVIFYSSKLFNSSGLTRENSDYATLGIGMVNVLITLVSVLLVDRVGRRSLHLAGLIGMLVFTVLLTGSLALRQVVPPLIYVAVVCVYLFVAFFAIGPGAIPWFIVAEMFTQESRDAAITVSVFVNWMGQIVLGIGYPQLLQYLKDYSFVPFIFCLILAILFTYKWLPETKGRSPDELESEFKLRAAGSGGPVGEYSQLHGEDGQESGPQL